MINSADAEKTVNDPVFRDLVNKLVADMDKKLVNTVDLIHIAMEDQHPIKLMLMVTNILRHHFAHLGSVTAAHGARPEEQEKMFRECMLQMAQSTVESIPALVAKDFVNGRLVLQR